MRRILCLFTSTLLWLPLTSCIDTAGSSAGKSATSSSSSSGSGSGSSTSSNSSYAGYDNAGSVKVIFNKQSFYNNFATNTLGCAGDAKAYYDPFSDRQVPVKPIWLKNISVEVTNSNALNGPSNALGCALSGLNAADASTCAGFDDGQPLSGESSKVIVVGGRGCLNGDATCTSGNTTNLLRDIWVGSISDVSSNAGWNAQSGVLDALLATSRGGAAWAGGDFDSLHNQFYTFGGVNLPAGITDPQGVLNYSTNLNKITLASDGTLSTNPAPDLLNFDLLPSNYSWGWDLSENKSPARRTGPSFTYSIRRDPTLKSSCTQTGGTCETTILSGTNNQVAINEHSDYFLMVGGLCSSTTKDCTAGQMSSSFYVYKPHAYSNDVGTGAVQPSSSGDWTRLHNDGTLNTTAMSIVDISTSSSSSTPYTVTTTTFSGRGYHRTVFDEKMNRFYIFGGLENSGGASAFTTAPDISTSAIWMYDPPSSARRPTAACWTDKDLSNNTLLTAGVNQNNFNSAQDHLGLNKEYLASKTVFPPGGCLQRIKYPNSEIPTARFEHGMAFDKDQGAVFIFGGCKSTAIIPSSGVSNGGNPLNNCTQNALMNDVWIYVPPKTTELVPSTYTASTGPYSSDKLLPNIFGSNFWLDHFPVYFDNTISSGAQSYPRTWEAMGKWISLSPTSTKPTVRASAGFVYDQAHHKFYLQGGYGCSSSACPEALNDMWEFTPPNIETECSVSGGYCNNQGTWKQIRSNNSNSGTDQPTLRYGFNMASTNPSFSHGDEFYTVTDGPCFGQGPIASNDPSLSKKNVGAIYIDLDRDKMGSAENVLINLRFLPFDSNTKLAGIYDNETPNVSSDDTDYASVNDEAVIRVQLMSNFLKYADQIQGLIQPRFHEYISSTPIYAETFAYVAGSSGQVTEKQILIPLNVSSSINMIKIERVQGSAKFFELTVSKF